MELLKYLNHQKQEDRNLLQKGRRNKHHCDNFLIFSNYLSHREAANAVNIDMNTVPVELKCAFSRGLLLEAVSLPCCQKVSYPYFLIIPNKLFSAESD
jgi:hypothetical protein